jgi:hypothetical protein
LQFDGVDDYVALNYAAPVNNFTVSAWVKATTTHEIDTEGTTGYLSGISGQRYLFGCTRGLVAADAGMGVSVGTNGISVYEHSSAYMPAIAVYEGSLGTGWNHIAVTYTNRQARIYLNGVLVRTGLTSPKGNVLAPVRLGSGAFGYGAFGGIVDKVCVLNYACADQQIQSIMNAGLNYNEAGLLGYWTFDEGAGTTAADVSGAYLAALYGPAWVN